MASLAFQETELPNGTKIRSRIVKAAMEENLADVKKHNQPSPELVRLYDEWGKGGAAIILSGHIMIDPRAMASPGDVLLAEDQGEFDEGLWRKWIQQTQQHGSQFWFQINHPGRQTRQGTGLPVYAPSPVRVDIGRMSAAFPQPLELSETQIEDIIRRFAWTAWKAEQLGASGVEIHAAHGYLLSQFLSPRTNLRSDKYGGSLENRARVLLDVVKAVRARVSPKFGVAIKINSSDFQRGGFGPDDLRWVVTQLNGLGLDFLELSGGSYEVPAMASENEESRVSESGKSARTRAREAYFLEAAKDLASITEMPLLVTGGISKLSTVNQVAESAPQGRVLLVGVGSALGLVPNLPNLWAEGKDPQPHLTSKSWILPKLLRTLAGIMGIQYALHDHGRGSKPWPGVWPLISVIAAAYCEQRDMAKYKKWVHSANWEKLDTAL